MLKIRNHLINVEELYKYSYKDGYAEFWYPLRKKSGNIDKDYFSVCIEVNEKERK